MAARREPAAREHGGPGHRDREQAWTSCGSPPPGSVDDGKSTLIGRLLYDSKSIFEDQMEAVERTSRSARRGVHQPGPADRRAARRARAGHHDRRRVPLLRDAAAEVHHRRHPGAHPVHPEHGDRRLDRRPGDHPGRRAQGPAGAVAAARVPDHAAAGAAPGARGQQDGPGRLRPGGLRADRGRVHVVRAPSWRSAT